MNNKKNSFNFNLSIDFIELSVNRNSIHSIQYLLNSFNGYSLKYYHSFRGGKSPASIYNYTIKLANQKTYVLDIAYPTKKYMPITIRILHPDMYSLAFVDNILANVLYHIGRIEVSMDFYTSNAIKMFNMIKRSIYLKWRGKPLNLTFPTTHYSNNIRIATSKGARAYIKNILQANNFVRVELIMKRRLLRKNGMNRICQITNTLQKTILKYISFKRFDYILFKKRYFCTMGKAQVNTINFRKFVKRINMLIYNGKLVEANNLSKVITYYGNIVYHEFNDIFVQVISNAMIR